jgi:hypothetical protein
MTWPSEIEQLAAACVKGTFLARDRQRIKDPAETDVAFGKN